MLEKEFELGHVKKLQDEDRHLAYYMIETEETQAGFPDVLVVSRAPGNGSSYLEYKVSDNKGRIKFQKSQPIFYRKNKFLSITIVALDARTNTIVMFSADSLFDNTSKYKLDLATRTVQL